MKHQEKSGTKLLERRKCSQCGIPNLPKWNQIAPKPKPNVIHIGVGGPFGHPTRPLGCQLDNFARTFGSQREAFWTPKSVKIESDSKTNKRRNKIMKHQEQSGTKSLERRKCSQCGIPNLPKWNQIAPKPKPNVIHIGVGGSFGHPVRPLGCQLENFARTFGSQREACWTPKSVKIESDSKTNKRRNKS